MLKLLPPSATADARRLLFTRGIRAFADGAVSIMLVAFLQGLGCSALQVGAILTGTMLGSAAITLAVGLLGQGIEPRRVLMVTAMLMCLTGLGFAGATSFWALFIVSVVGTLNPSWGDVSVFLPMEQAALSETVKGADRTAIFAWYNVCGSFAGAFGALASPLPEMLATYGGRNPLVGERWAFLAYAGIALIALFGYRALSPAEKGNPIGGFRAPLRRSRRIVLELSALFSLDSLAGGLAVQSILALWLYRRFDLSPQSVGTMFFVSGLLNGCSQFVSAWLARRIGLINTMVFTHLPANVFMILAGVMPTAPLAITFLLLRTPFSGMDVPARQSYVMAVVPPEERPAAASVTNVPRSLAAGLTPLLAGLLLEYSAFGWPLIICGVLKILYDIILLIRFRAVQPLSEAA